MSKRKASNPPAIPKANVSSSGDSGRGSGVSRDSVVLITGGLVFAVLLAWVGLMNRGQLNTDGIAYVQIARHYAAGRFDLAVSGYWGPLFSWLMVPWLKLGISPLDAGRAVMAISGMVFAAGSGRFLLSVLDDKWAVRIGTALAGVAALFWSAQYLTPDLLALGLLLLALGELFRKGWLEKSGGDARAGVFLGLAYLAKAVAFPVAGLLILLSAVLWAGTKQSGWKSAWMAAIKTGAVFALMALPWMGVLTAKYGAPTFSTSGKINHAIVGPSDVERWHSFGRTFQTPEPGRLTVWEEPSPRDYKYWSPFQNAAYFQHQVGLVKKNLETVAGLLFQVDWIGFGLLSLLACVVILPPWRERLGTERWRWGAFALAITAGIYLPVYVRVADDRYFYIAFPLFWSTAAGVVLWMTSKSAAKNPWPRRIGLGIVTVSFGFFPAFRAVSAAGGLNNPPVVAAHMLSERLIKAGLAGPVAGSASIFGERAGLYTAFLLDQPWVGDKPDATLQEWRDSGARLVILKRDDPQAAVLSTAPGFRDLDGALSSDPSWNSGFPLKVFEILR